MKNRGLSIPATQQYQGLIRYQGKGVLKRDLKEGNEEALKEVYKDLAFIRGGIRKNRKVLVCKFNKWVMKSDTIGRGGSLTSQ